MEWDSETVKIEEAFFGTFNTEDILTDPTCENNGQIREENQLSLQNDFRRIQPDPMTENMAFLNNSRMEPIIDVQDTNQARNEHEHKAEGTSFGLKIADFAIDPDSCAIISEQKVTSMQATATQNKIWTPPILQKSLNPEDISFKDHHLQYTKLYQVKYQPHSQEFKEYYILTSHHKQNNVEFKLFIPFSFNLSRENVKELKAHNSEGKDIFHIKVQNSSLIAPDIQDISSFLHSIYALKCIMVTAENIQKFAIKFKELSNNLNELVPTFRYRIKEIVSILVKTDRELGNEGVAKLITNNERLKTVKKIRDEIQKYYPPSALHKVAYTACLMEQDINRKFSVIRKHFKTISWKCYLTS